MMSTATTQRSTRSSGLPWARSPRHCPEIRRQDPATRAGLGGGDPRNPSGSAPSGGAGPGANAAVGGAPPGGGCGNSNQPSNQPPGRTPPQQSGGAGQPGGHPGAPAGHPSVPHAQHPIDPWTPLDRYRKSLPQFKLPSITTSHVASRHAADA